MQARRTRGVVVELENTPGTLGKLAQSLGTEEINIQGYAAVAHENSGTLLLVTEQGKLAETVLEEAGYAPKTWDALIVELHDEPGRLGEVSAALGRAGVNIEASFVTGMRDGIVECAFSVDDVERAEKVLEGL